MLGKCDGMRAKCNIMSLNMNRWRTKGTIKDKSLSYIPSELTAKLLELWL